MSEKDNGGQAYPRPLGSSPSGRYSDSQSGMTMRQYYKGQAIVGIMQAIVSTESIMPFGSLADIAGRMADSLIEEDII